MILGHINQIGPEIKYLPAVFQKAFLYLKETDFSVLENKKYQLLGDEMFVVINEYKTGFKESKQAEAHQKYLDIHFIISGEETIGVGAPDPANELLEKYNPEQDVTFYKTVINESALLLAAGNYAIFFPNDLHRPGCNLTRETEVRKAVVKISLNLLKD